MSFVEFLHLLSYQLFSQNPEWLSDWEKFNWEWADNCEDNFETKQKTELT